MSQPVVFVDIYQGKSTSPKRPQAWRWRAFNEGNTKILAVSSEAYTNKGDCIDAIEQLFGAGTTVILRQHEKGNELLRRSRVTDA